MKFALKLSGMLVPALYAFSLTSQAAPGGVDPGFWVKSDDAGDIATAWKDHSPYGNDIEAEVDLTEGAEPWVLSTANAAHNFHPYTTGYSRYRRFLDLDASFIPSGNSETPLTILAVTRLASLPVGENVARITGIDNSLSETATYANEPGLSVTGNTHEQAGRLQIRYENAYGSSENLYSQLVPLGRTSINHATIGGNNNVEVSVGFDSSTSYTVGDSVRARGDTLSIGYGLSPLFFNEAFNGDIMEVLWYPIELTELQEQQAYSYLAVKHGIHLTQDYLASDESVVWGLSVDTDYNHNIFGLGKDSVSSLDQKVSRAAGDSALTVSTSGDFLSSNSDGSRISVASDLTYFLLGDNAGSKTFSSGSVPSGYSLLMERAWLVQEKGSAGNLSLKFDLPTLPSGATVYLVRRSGSDDFSSAETLGEIDKATGVITNVDLNNGDYFTVALTLDSDGDGYLDGDDAFPNDPSEWIDTDSDGTGDNADTDDDNDRYTDDDEIAAGTDPLDSSSVPADNDRDYISDVTDTDDDNDRLSDSDEAIVGSDPFNRDSDGDGVPDGREVGSNPNVPADEDGDGIPDVFEVTNDSDRDGLSNYAEGLIGSHPLMRDTDGDDIRDNEELAVVLLGTDSDDDGIDDAMDADFAALVAIGAPDRNGDGIADFALRDTDDNGTPDLLDTDSDADGIDDVSELLEDSDEDGIVDVLDPVGGSGGGDSDGDLLADVFECCADSDLNAVPDYMQLDSDNDSIPDTFEAGLTGLDDDADGYDNRYDADLNGDGVIDQGADENADGMVDGWIVLDTDGDGFADFRDTDSDNDGISDEDETSFGVILDADADGDAIPDQVDASSGENGGDSDGDGLTDSEECPEGYPLCRDTDKDGTPDYMTTDSDGDGIPDGEDQDTTEGGGDSDGDGVSDGDECPAEQAVDGECVDTDGDGIPDYLDEDSQPVIDDTPEQAPGNSAEALKDHMTASTGLGSTGVLWLLAGGLLILRRVVSGAFIKIIAGLMALGALPVHTLQVQALELPWGISEERFYVVGGPEYSRFTPVTSGSVYQVEDMHDWGFSGGAGYDLTDQLAIEFDYAAKGELLASNGAEIENTQYSFSTVNALWYPDIWYSNRRYDDDWPYKLNWYISGGFSRMFLSGSASTELQNNVNVALGAGVTYGLSSGTEIRFGAERVSGDVFSWGLGLVWYPFAPEGRGRGGEAAVAEDVMPVYKPYQVASERVANSHVADCALEVREPLVEFEAGSYLVRKQYAPALAELTDTFFRCPGVTIVIVGSGEIDAPQASVAELAYKRAREVFQYLIRRGVPSNKVAITTRHSDSYRTSPDRADVFFAR